MVILRSRSSWSDLAEDHRVLAEDVIGNIGQDQGQSIQDVSLLWFIAELYLMCHIRHLGR